MSRRNCFARTLEKIFLWVFIFTYFCFLNLSKTFNFVNKELHSTAIGDLPDHTYSEFSYFPLSHTISVTADDFPWFWSTLLVKLPFCWSPRFYRITHSAKIHINNRNQKVLHPKFEFLWIWCEKYISLPFLGYIWCRIILFDGRGSVWDPYS